MFDYSAGPRGLAVMAPLRAAPDLVVLWPDYAPEREFRVPPMVATWACLYGSLANRRLDRRRRDGGRLVLVGGCHRGGDPRSSQPLRVPAHRTCAA